jgi:hypothetical protein
MEARLEILSRTLFSWQVSAVLGMTGSQSSAAFDKIVSQMICRDATVRKLVAIDGYLKLKSRFFKRNTREGAYTRFRFAIISAKQDNMPGKLHSASSQEKLTRTISPRAQVNSRRQKIVPFLQRLLTSSALLESIQNTTDLSTSQSTDSILSLAAEAGLREEDLRRQLTDAESVSRSTTRLQEHLTFCETVLDLPRGTSAVVTNGRITTLPATGPALHAEDFGLLESLEFQARAEAVLPLVEKADFAGIEPDDLTSEFLSNVVMGATSALAGRKRSSGGTANFDILKTEHSAIMLEGDPESHISIEAVIDPLSASAQKLTSLLVLLHEWLDPSIRVILNPVSGLSDIPLKNFYRWASVSGPTSGVSLPFRSLFRGSSLCLC